MEADTHQQCISAQTEFIVPFACMSTHEGEIEEEVEWTYPSVVKNFAVTSNTKLMNAPKAVGTF